MFKTIRLFPLLTILHVGLVPIAPAQEQQPAKTAGDLEPIGYFLGLSVGQDMRRNGFQPGDFDIDSLLEGFKDGMNNREAALSNEQLKETQTKLQTLLQQRQAAMRKAQNEKEQQFFTANAKEKGVKALERGIQYKVLAQGDGQSPTATDTVTVHYTGQLVNGTVFDSSVKRGKPATFRVNGVIPGWQVALQKMKVGDKWTIYIPSSLAYGAAGSPPVIGPNEILIFDVELLSIQ